MKQINSDKIKIDLNVLLNSKDKIKNIIHKHNCTIKQSQESCSKTNVAYETIHMLLLSTLSFIPYFFIEKSLFPMIYLILISLSFSITILPLINDQKSFINILKSYCSSLFFKSKIKNKLSQLIFNKNGIITKKSNEIINDFYNYLTEEDFKIHEELLSQFTIEDNGKLESYESIIYGEIDEYLLTHSKEEILSNQELILSLIDSLEEKSIEVDTLTELYISKTQKTGKYKNNKLNQITNHKSHKNTLTSDNLVIKQI
jgi:hypothetical protein